MGGADGTLLLPQHPVRDTVSGGEWMIIVHQFCNCRCTCPDSLSPIFCRGEEVEASLNSPLTNKVASIRTKQLFKSKYQLSVFKSGTARPQWTSHSALHSPPNFSDRLHPPCPIPSWEVLIHRTDNLIMQCTYY